ncbi:MAG: 50S ribosomal protein L13 [Nanoarchaeota archaeon]|nr:50S ribosomal protein L13 [Nanoarchaeota archaeon]MBU1028012.1 50S ribosomal protein L13 [Nanoarchaeota archaeon]
MKIINGKNAILGRLASYIAKEALKGEEIVLLNCNQIVITGNKKDIKEKFEAKRQRVGSGQKGPKISRVPYLIVKRTIRGMIPNHRKGRGKQALKRIKCYSKTPKEFEESKKIIGGKEKKTKFLKINELKK